MNESALMQERIPGNLIQRELEKDLERAKETQDSLILKLQQRGFGLDALLNPSVPTLVQQKTYWEGQLRKLTGRV